MLRKSVKIGGDVFRINYVPLLCEGRERILAGLISYDDALIKIGTDRAVSRQKQTLWHEAVHAIIKLRGVETHVDDEQLETLVDQIAEGLNALMLDNGVEFWEMPDKAKPRKTKE
jgi:Zn-dependent peptidase ImmA (M78 family)